VVTSKKARSDKLLAEPAGQVWSQKRVGKLSARPQGIKCCMKRGEGRVGAKRQKKSNRKGGPNELGHGVLENRE